MRATSIEARGQHRLQALQHLSGVGPSFGRIHRATGQRTALLCHVLHHAGGQQLHPLAGVAGVAPWIIAQRLKHVGACAGPWRGPVGAQGVKVRQPQVLRQRHRQAGLGGT